MTDRYSLADLDVESVPVIFGTGAGERVGFMKIVGRGARARRTFRVREEDGKLTDVGQNYLTGTWRPARPEEWPARLPEPAWPTKEQKRLPDPPRAPYEPLSELEWWVSPPFRLGNPGEPPAHLEECEARILLALRTDYYLEHLDDYGPPAAWPGAFMKAARTVALALKAAKDNKLPWLRPEDYDDFHIDRSDLRALPAKWEPTRRDVGDAEPGRAISWVMDLDLSRKDWRILHWRSASPPYSWSEISILDGRSRQVLNRRYRKIIERAFQRATA